MKKTLSFVERVEAVRALVEGPQSGAQWVEAVALLLSAIQTPHKLFSYGSITNAASIVAQRIRRILEAHEATGAFEIHSGLRFQPRDGQHRYGAMRLTEALLTFDFSGDSEEIIKRLEALTIKPPTPVETPAVDTRSLLQKALGDERVPVVDDPLRTPAPKPLEDFVQMAKNNHLFRLFLQNSVLPQCTCGRNMLAHAEYFGMSDLKVCRGFTSPRLKPEWETYKARFVSNRLVWAGLLGYQVDQWTPEVDRALRTFQKSKKGLKETGSVDNATYDSLCY